MKKTLLTVATSVVVAFGVQAQSQPKASAGDFKFGFKGGYNLSSLGGDVEDVKSLSGFHLGAFVEVPVSEKFAIQGEVLYSAQGVKSKYSESEAFLGNTYEYRYESKSHLNYINVPVFAKYYVLDKLSIEAGPQFGFLVGAKNKGSEYETMNGVVRADESFNRDIKDGLKTFEFGLGIGASYYFTENLFAGARYNFGLSNVEKDNDFKVHNNVLQVSVGYRF